MLTETDDKTIRDIFARHGTWDDEALAGMVADVESVIRHASVLACGGVGYASDRHSINGLCAAITLVVAAELMLRQAGIEMALPVPERGRAPRDGMARDIAAQIEAGGSGRQD